MTILLDIWESEIMVDWHTDELFISQNDWRDEGMEGLLK